MRPFLIIILLFALHFASKAQITIKGRVVSQNNAVPLAEANIIVNGTGKQATSNSNGYFNIIVSEGKHHLKVSLVGYRTRQIEIETTNVQPIVIALEVEETNLKEVTIQTGYQEIKPERITGAVSVVNSELINRSVSTNILDRLQDVVPGLVFNRSGVPFGQSPITIRGQSTIFANKEPLIVVDNFPYTGDIGSINPNDVANITVLKDAGAASIWGARAGNGVIVITTKKGQYKQPIKVSLNSNVTIFNRPDLHYLPIMSSPDFIETEKRLFSKNYYQSTEQSLAKLPLTPVIELLILKRDGKISAEEVDRQIEALKAYDVRNDIEKYLYRKAVNQQTAISISGGSEKNAFFISAGYDKNLQSLVNNEFSRFTLNASNTLNLLDDRLEITAGIYYTKTFEKANNEGTGNLVQSGSALLYPYAKLADEQGNSLAFANNYRYEFMQNASKIGLLDWQYKPLDEINLANNTTRTSENRINTSVKYKITSGLDVTILYQYNHNDSKNRNIRDISTYYTRNQINRLSAVDIDGNIIRPIPLGGILDLSNSTFETQNLRGQINYAKQWDKHGLTVFGGYEIQDKHTLVDISRFYGFDDEHATSKTVDYNQNYTLFYNSSSTQNKIPNLDNFRDLTDRYKSVYGNVAYAFSKRYTVTLSARTDESNLFGVKTNQKGVPLWSAGMGWNINEETFYKIAWLPSLKLRFTYGYNGNVDKSLSAYTTARYNDGTSTQSRLPYATIENPPNPQLKWEKVRVINAGLDFGIINNVLYGSIDFYRKNGFDLIGTTPFPPSSGITLFKGNYANTVGNGIDVILNSRNMNLPIGWQTTFLFSYNKDKVTKYMTTSTASNLLDYGLSGNYPVLGKPLYAIYSYAWAGLDPQTGDPIGVFNGQESKNYNAITSTTNPLDIVYHGTSRPTYFGALRNSFTYKYFSISANISYRLGYYFRKRSVVYGNNDGLGTHGDFIYRWQKQGDEAFTNIPSIPAAFDSRRDYFYTNSSVLVLKGDHIRLQDIQFSYTIDKEVVKVLPFRSVKLYGYINNLGIIWKANKVGIDPDYQEGIPPRTFSLGLTVNFN